MARPFPVPRATRRHRRMIRAASRDLSAHMLRDIGLDPWPEPPHFPPFAALIARD